MQTSYEHLNWPGRAVVDADGKKIGTVLEVLSDPETDVPWIVIGLGRFGEPITLAPATGGYESADGLTLPLHHDIVDTAPRAIGENAWTAGSFRSLLYRHYGLTNLPRRRAHPAARTVA
jgi:hypothetical protein